MSDLFSDLLAAIHILDHYTPLTCVPIRFGHSLSQVIAKYMDVKYHFYVNDNQLLIHLSPGNCAISFQQLKACLNDIHI